MRRNFIASCVAVAVTCAAGGLMAGRAMAKDDPAPAAPAMPPAEKAIDGNPLVKALTASKWTTKSSSSMGNGAGTNAYHLAAGKTVLVQDYESKGTTGEYAGLGVYKLSADGKTATLWWFNTMSNSADQYTGPVTDTGYELSGTVDNMAGGKAKAELKLAKKGETFEFTYTMDDQLMFTDVYTPAK